MEQILFLALLAVVGLLRWFSQMAEEKRNREAEKRTGTPPPNVPVQRAPAETEEERIRRFMEALGVPTSNAPVSRVEREAPKPPAAPKRTAPPIDPFPRGGLPIPPVVSAPPPPPPPPRAPQPPLVPRAPTATPPAPPPLPTRETTMFADRAPERLRHEAGAGEFEVRDIDDAAAEAARTAAARRRKGDARSAPAAEPTLVARLASRDGLRDAIVLREIFGPPRSLQPLEPHRAEIG